MQDLDRPRDKMVEHQLEARGIKEPVLEAMRQVPREEFVPEAMVDFAYEDSPLPIGGRMVIPTGSSHRTQNLN